MECEMLGMKKMCMPKGSEGGRKESERARGGGGVEGWGIEYKIDLHMFCVTSKLNIMIATNIFIQADSSANVSE